MNSYQLADRINTQVNDSVTYKTDLAQYGRPEYWCEAGRYGDCEDYALLKRQLLLEQGWPNDKLILACCDISPTEYHCVLIAETDKGFYVLDNRHPNLMQPSLLPYKWDKGLRGDKWYELSF